MIENETYDHSEILNNAEMAAKLAGAILLEGLDRKIEINYKSRIDPVTEVDLASQKCILDYLEPKYPEHTFIAEEQDNTIPAEDEAVWLIDPLDGTTNYSHGYRCFCVSIALVLKGKISVGAVYDPWADEMFSAIRGSGAKLNGKPLTVTGQDDLNRSLLVTGFPYDIRESKVNNLGLFNHLVMKAQAVRRDGSAALDLAYVAAGRFDGFWELKLKPWDMAAGALLVAEAGGKISRFDGSDFEIHSFDLLATNGKIHEAMISEISEVPSDRW